MYDGPMNQAVNEFLLRPEALEVVSGIVAAGLGGLSIWKLIDYVGAPKPNREQAREVDLLDEQKPEWFLPSAIQSVHGSLLAREMRGDKVAPRVSWRRGLWRVRHMGVTWTDDPWLDPDATAFDLTDIATPVMKNGELR